MVKEIRTYVYSFWHHPRTWKIPFSRTAAHIFVSSGDAPATITQYSCMDGKIFTARCICISAVYAVTRCPSDCLSVTFRSCAKTNKDIFEIFSPSGSDTILVFPYHRGCRYSDVNPLTGASNTRVFEKLQIFFTNISLYLINGYT